MRLKVINSNSRGNAYLLENDQEALLIECGVRFELIKRALDFNLSRVAGALVSHSHGDHCSAVKDVTHAGINVYATHGTCEELLEKWSPNPHRLKPRHLGIAFTVGGFQILPFRTEHDCKEPCGFLIKHEECGTTLFLTDTVFSPYVFWGLNNIIVEANYCEEILEEKRRSGSTIEMLRDRVIESHMSLQNCKDMLTANDLSQVNNIVLIHLSDKHSHAERFKAEVEQLTGKTVTVADANMVIDNFNRTPF